MPGFNVEIFRARGMTQVIEILASKSKAPVPQGIFKNYQGEMGVGG
jgi:hypothetical protein